MSIVGRLGPAFETSKKYRICVTKKFSDGAFRRVYKWFPDELEYGPVTGTIPIIPGEFIDIAMAEFEGKQWPFVARQFDDVLAVILPDTWFDLLDKTTNEFWIEEV